MTHGSPKRISDTKAGSHSGNTVVVRTIVIPPDDLTKEWNEIVSPVQEILV